MQCEAVSFAFLFSAPPPLFARTVAATQFRDRTTRPNIVWHLQRAYGMAAIDGDVRSVHELRRLTAQQKQSPVQFVQLPQALNWHVCLDVLAALRRVVVLLRHLSPEIPRADGVDPNAVLHHLQREGPRHLAKAGFGDRVHRMPIANPHAEDAADVDDAPVPHLGCLHALGRFLGHEEGALEVHVERRVVRVLSFVQGAASRANACVVDDHIKDLAI
mmetsp:Transcript_20934/g.53008  ORF Transcript_20934/g.53008 Transcript_20934/m.53008 type:complete len:217 (+) Transcript_20934:539-1189(+)